MWYSLIFSGVGVKSFTLPPVREPYGCTSNPPRCALSTHTHNETMHEAWRVMWHQETFMDGEERKRERAPLRPSRPVVSSVGPGGHVCACTFNNMYHMYQMYNGSCRHPQTSILGLMRLTPSNYEHVASTSIRESLRPEKTLSET